MTAVRQVDDAEASYRAQQQRLASLDRALQAARQATQLATERYDRGLSDFLNVLDAEREQYELEERHVVTRQAEADDLVMLYKALGGGWPSNEVIRSCPRPQPALIAASSTCSRPPAKSAGSGDPFVDKIVLASFHGTLFILRTKIPPSTRIVPATANRIGIATEFRYQRGSEHRRQRLGARDREIDHAEILVFAVGRRQHRGDHGLVDRDIGTITQGHDGGGTPRPLIQV